MINSKGNNQLAISVGCFHNNDFIILYILQYNNNDEGLTWMSIQSEYALNQ